MASLACKLALRESPMGNRLPVGWGGFARNNRSIRVEWMRAAELKEGFAYFYSWPKTTPCYYPPPLIMTKLVFFESEIHSKLLTHDH